MTLDPKAYEFATRIVITGQDVLDPEHLADILNRLEDDILGIQANMLTVERAIRILQEHAIKGRRPKSL